MAFNTLTTQILKRLIFEEKQRILRESKQNNRSGSMKKEHQLLALLERAERKNKIRSAKLRKVKQLLKKRINRR